jgi:putative ABC transport system permease protein
MEPNKRLATASFKEKHGPTSVNRDDLMAGIWQDVRYGARNLWKSPSFTLTALLSLALGIGATTAVFSVIYAVLIHPYPYAGADRMVRLQVEDQAGVSRNFFLTGRQLQQLQQANSAESVLGQTNWEESTTGSELPEDVRAVFLTPNASSFFGVPALLGRGLLPSDAPDGQDPLPVGVLSFSFWQRHFGGRADVLGKTLGMAHKNYTIVGVLPPRFAWTFADVYLPLKVTNDLKDLVWVSCVKLKQGVGRDTAKPEFQTLLEQFAKETPGNFPGTFRVHLDRLIDEHSNSFEHMLYLLFAGVALLLFIGCSNVSILLLAKDTVRQHELAVRASVGASRSRIVRQLLTETLLLSLSGVVLGILLAYGGLTLIVRWLPRTAYPYEAVVQINLPVLCCSVGVALLTGLLFGLSPALQFSRPDLSQVMQSSARTVGGGARAKHTHGLLIASQISLTLLLLAAAAAALQGFLHLVHTPLGYDPRYTIVAGIPLHDNTYMKWEERAAYFRQLRESVAAIPGVTSAAISTEATPPFDGKDETVEIMGRGAGEEQRIRLSMVSPEYFSVLHVALLHGRTWDEFETMHGAHVAVINQTMAREYWPDGDMLGHEVRMPNVKNGPFRVVAPGGDQWFQIVGVIADARNDGLAKPVRPAVYVPYTIWMEMYTHILVHTQVAPASLFRSVRAQVRLVDPDQQVEGDGQSVSLEELLARAPEWQQGHLASMLLGAFAVMALMLALVGLYSVVYYTVAQRTGEFGIRMALGAQRRDVLWLIFSTTTVSVGSGLAAGVFLSMSLTKILARWTETSSHEPLLILCAALLMIGASTVACLLPARRASLIDPMTALRRE